MKANLDIEKDLWQSGYRLIAGVDEAGRGPLAGPVVAAAVILPIDFNEPLVNDSKQLTKKERESLKVIIEEKAAAIGIAIISEKVIDRINILEASRMAMKEAIKNLKLKPDFVLTDYMDIGSIPHQSLVHGDERSVSIAAASIIAKVTRDELMRIYHLEYPDYDFLHNQGYGTKKHLDALVRLGPSPIHRMTFAPVKKCIDNIQ